MQELLSLMMQLFDLGADIGDGDFATLGYGIDQPLDTSVDLLKLLR